MLRRVVLDAVTRGEWFSSCAPAAFRGHAAARATSSVAFSTCDKQRLAGAGGAAAGRRSAVTWSSSACRRTFATEAEAEAEQPTIPSEMRVTQLREELRAPGIPFRGLRKPALVDTLEKARDGDSVSDDKSASGPSSDRRRGTNEPSRASFLSVNGAFVYVANLPVRATRLDVKDVFSSTGFEVVGFLTRMEWERRRSEPTRRKSSFFQNERFADIPSLPSSVSAARRSLRSLDCPRRSFILSVSVRVSPRVVSSQLPSAPSRATCACFRAASEASNEKPRGSTRVATTRKREEKEE